MNAHIGREGLTMKTFYKVQGTLKAHAHFTKNGNIKLGGNVWTFSKLFGDFNYTIEDDNGMHEIIGSCGHYCNGCKKACYVKSSYRYPSVVKCHTENTMAFREDIGGAFNDLYNQISNARNKPDLIRINQSGEIESHNGFILWCSLAMCFPYVKFWVYTKAFDLVKASIPYLPENLTVNFSIWHEYGLEEYIEAKNFKGVNAFAYVDKDFTIERYQAEGLAIQTTCKAYENGKLNHSITCHKCGKCFHSGLVIGCNEH